ncbi:hypothetical protein KU75_22915 [Pectobacterium odoriferum]|uniref:Uncharacterized protein n=1 Tax=Pectobacterium odoriferum TaxID=78398 RepID=A0ABR4VJ71_9GAMM|nr:hypothetical protein [Pectobacterium odoriferum]KGA39408.1 hypothetical protein KU75_22915 [Pectobacterium odoriferum]
MEQTATLRIQTDENGNKYIAGAVIGDATISKLYIKPDDTDEQRRNAALESRVAMLELQLTQNTTQLDAAMSQAASTAVELLSLNQR